MSKEENEKHIGATATASDKQNINLDKMIKGKALALLLLLGLAAFAITPARAEVEAVDDDEYEDLDSSAFLLVRRKLSDDKPLLGKVTTVTVEIHNAGKSAAQSVGVHEQPWSVDNFLTEGQLSAEYDSIPTGATQSFSYSITPKGATGYLGGPTTIVSYVADGGGKPVTTTASILYAHVHSSTDLLKFKALSAGSTISLGILNTEKDWIRFGAVAGAGAAVYLLLGVYKAAAKTRADVRRRKALRDLGVDADDFKTK